MSIPGWAFWLFVLASAATLCAVVFGASWLLWEWWQGRDDSYYGDGPSEDVESAYGSTGSDLGMTGAVFIPEWEEAVTDAPAEYLYLSRTGVSSLYAQVFDSPEQVAIESGDSTEVHGGARVGTGLLGAQADAKSSLTALEKRTYGELPLELQLKQLIRWLQERGRLYRYDMDVDHTKSALTPVEYALEALKSEQGISVDERTRSNLMTAIARQAAARAAGDLDQLKKKYLAVSGTALIESAEDGLHIRFSHVMNRHMRRFVKADMEGTGVRQPVQRVMDTIEVEAHLERDGLGRVAGEVLQPGKTVHLSMMGMAVEYEALGRSSMEGVRHILVIAPLAVDTA